MKVNMGNKDRFVRFLIVAVFYMLVYTGVITGTLKIAVGLMGLVILQTALIGICPLYGLMGFNTSSADKVNAE